MPARRWIGSYLEQVDRPDRLGTQQRLDDQPQLSVAEHPDDVLMPFDEALQLMTRERLRRPADRPNVASRSPTRTSGRRRPAPQARRRDGAALDVHYNADDLVADQHAPRPKRWRSRSSSTRGTWCPCRPG